MIGPDTMVLTVQNGVEAPYRVGELIGSEHVVAGVSVINAHLTSPGFVTHHGGKQLILGELDNGSICHNRFSDYFVSLRSIRNGNRRI